MKQAQEFEINYFQDEDGMFNAAVPAIRGCVAWGKTLNECHRNAVDAIESCLKARGKISTTKLRKLPSPEDIRRRAGDAKAKAVALQAQRKGD